MRKKITVLYIFGLLFLLTGCGGGSSSSSAYVSVGSSVTGSIVPTISAFSASVDENASINTVVGTISVTDSGDSSISSFTLSDTTNFSIASSGVITTKTLLDYEAKSVYNLSVYATNEAGDSTSKDVTININDIDDDLATVIKIPTIVVVMNWDDYFETDSSIWYDKIFNKSLNSVNRWFYETTEGELQLEPITESSGTANDGIIMVNMGISHPGSSSGDESSWRDTHLSSAITNLEVVNNADFAALDTNANGSLDRKELNIIFIVAGGEESYTDDATHSIWAHAWSFPSDSNLTVDGKYVMKYTGVEATSGTYGRFGANHDDHKATIGIIAHELGHSLLALDDYYDPFNISSGLGWYDIMSSGSWARKVGDAYYGETPTQYSAFNRADSFLDVNVTTLNSSSDVTIKCSSKNIIKLETSSANEYFLVECRDTAKINSDISVIILIMILRKTDSL
ncbi:cadherin domain-containing protein [Sulfurimonas lithotrophica]|nr:cadherin domain-containing protein [Sulfurimonas lithotrophica]